jgi:hypothetical protein
MLTVHKQISHYVQQAIDMKFKIVVVNFIHFIWLSHFHPV